MYLGDHVQNMRDMVADGHSLKGEKHPAAVLSEEQVVEIRGTYRRGTGLHHRGNSAELANRFGVTQQAIWAVMNGRTWSHVNQPSELPAGPA